MTYRTTTMIGRGSPWQLHWFWDALFVREGGIYWLGAQR